MIARTRQTELLLFEDAKLRAHSDSRFWAKVAPATDGCWNWTGGRTVDGYGMFSIKSTGVRAHRIAYSLVVGRIPDGLTLDHGCYNRACVNPAHLTPMTSEENCSLQWGALKTHCKQGHPLFGDNLRFQIRDGRSHRVCRTCTRLGSHAAHKKSRARRRAEREVAANG